MFIETDLTYNEFGDIDYYRKHKSFKKTLFTYEKSKDKSPKEIFLMLNESRKRAQRNPVIINYRQWNAKYQDPAQETREEKRTRLEDEWKSKHGDRWWSPLQQFPPITE